MTLDATSLSFLSPGGTTPIIRADNEGREWALVPVGLAARDIDGIPTVVVPSRWPVLRRDSQTVVLRCGDALRYVDAARFVPPTSSGTLPEGAVDAGEICDACTAEAVAAENRFPNPGEEVPLADGPCCYLCGRPMRRRGYTIHVVDGGAALSASLVVEDPASDLGFYDVGPECAKKIPAEFLHPDVIGAES